MDKQEIMDRVDALASKLGVAAEHMWVVLVRQASIEATAYLVAFAVVWSLLLVALTTSIRRSCFDEDGEPENMWGICSVIFGALVLFFIIPTMVHVPELVTKALNPEYHAVQEIMGVFK